MTNSILDKIQNRLWQDKQPVTARWVCYEYICQMAGAQEVLKECKDANKGKLVITWLLEGIAVDSGHRAVRVVSDSHAEEAKQAFSEVLSEQIYSLTPSVAAPDASSLIAGDLEQARKMMAGLLKDKTTDSQVDAFLQNGCSMVKGAPCVREVIQRKQKPAAPVAAQAKKPPLASKLGQQKPKSTSAPAAASLDKTGKKDSGKQEPVVKPEAARASKGKGKANNPLANSFSKSTDKRPAKAAENAPTTAKPEKAEDPEDVPMSGQDSDEEEPAVQRSDKKNRDSQQVLDDDDEDDGLVSQSPLPTKQRAAKAKQVLLDDSDDDDFAPAPKEEKKEAEPAKKAVQAKSKTPAATASKKKAPAKGAASDSKAKEKAIKVEVEADCDMEDSEDVKQAPDTAAHENSDPGDAVKASESASADVKAHDEYGAPPHPDAEITMIGSRTVWQYINDKGEEVTVEVKKPAAAKPAVVKQQVPSKRAKPESQEEAAQDADEPKAVKKKKATTKHQKAAVQASDIRNLFGKKK